MRTAPRRWMLVSLVAALCLVVSALGAQAQEETAATGNGGTAGSSANGGAAAMGNLNSGGNSGNAVGLGDSSGEVAVDGGAVAQSTALDLALDGGTAIGDASGGDDDTAFTRDRLVLPAPPAPAPPAPEPPAPTPTPAPEPVPIPRVCVMSFLGTTACSLVFDCFEAAPGEIACTIPDCTAAVGVAGPCTGSNCEPGPNATTNCTLFV